MGLNGGSDSAVDVVQQQKVGRVFENFCYRTLTGRVGLPVRVLPLRHTATLVNFLRAAHAVTRLAIASGYA